MGVTEGQAETDEWKGSNAVPELKRAGFIACALRVKVADVTAVLGRKTEQKNLVQPLRGACHDWVWVSITTVQPRKVRKRQGRSRPQNNNWGLRDSGDPQLGEASGEGCGWALVGSWLCAAVTSLACTLPWRLEGLTIMSTAS